MLLNFMNIPDKERLRVVVEDDLTATSSTSTNKENDNKPQRKPEKEKSKEEEDNGERKVRFAPQETTEKIKPEGSEKKSLLKKKVNAEQVSAKVDQEK
mmetsp:Transcript_14059/g.12031  ORF Transcript_14059/g.12031 Transcript_14059/m.12031 type:complete len:98 (-) Transcript_14059:366-659(-)